MRATVLSAGSKMNDQRWAIFLIFLVSSQYVGTVLGQSTCVPTQKMVQTFNTCFNNVRSKMQPSYPVDDTTVDGLQLQQGTVTGLQNFKVDPPTCSCLPGAIRIFIKLSFLDVTVTFLVTLLDGLLGGLLGNLGSTLARLVGQLVNTVVRLVALEINIVIGVQQRLIPGATCTVISYQVTRVSEIKVLGIDLSQLVIGLLGDILTPVVDALVQNLLNRQVRAIITQEIGRVRITPDMHNCGNPLPPPMGY